MGLHRDLADRELGPNLLVQQPRDHECHHIALAMTQRCVAIPQLAQLLLAPERVLAARERLADGGKDDVVAERLGEKLDRAGLHRAYRHRHVGIPRDEDDRHVRPIGSDALLQVEAVEIRKPDVEDQAARRERARMGKECRGGGKCCRIPTGTLNERVERLAHGNVVIDDEHDRRCARPRDRSRYVRELARSAHVSPITHQRSDPFRPLEARERVRRSTHPR